MTVQGAPAAVGFHSGELAVQRQAGVEAEAARLVAMVGRAQLRAGMAAFLSEATVAAMAARDGSGRLWTSPLLGPPGFLEAASPTTLKIHTPLPSAEPLHGLSCGQSVGVIAMNFLTRRRVRINGLLTSTEAGALTIDVDQAYGNCPQYIQQRHVHVDGPPDDNRARLYSGNTLRPKDIRLIEAADTFFLGTIHATAGSDASHRGGPPGFVRLHRGACGGPTIPATTCSTASATSPPTPPRRCCSSTSAPASRFSSPVARPSAGATRPPWAAKPRPDAASNSFPSG